MDKALEKSTLQVSLSNPSVENGTCTVNLNLVEEADPTDVYTVAQKIGGLHAGNHRATYIIEKYLVN